MSEDAYRIGMLAAVWVAALALAVVAFVAVNLPAGEECRGWERGQGFGLETNKQNCVRVLIDNRAPIPIQVP